jgi:serine/threonine protein kinase
MVLEFCNKGTLSDAIQRGWLLSVRDGAPQPGQLNLSRALATAREVAGAMEYLHGASVLHGDLNGNNILLAGAPLAPDRADHRGFTAKVADFGLSRILTLGELVMLFLLFVVVASLLS